MAETATLSRFEVIFDAEGVNRSKFRNDVRVHLRGPYAVSYRRTRVGFTAATGQRLIRLPISRVRSPHV